MDKIRFGILSTAKIGRKDVIPALQESQHNVVTAIASRSLERAQDTADELDIPTAYGSYEELLDDPEVDAIYNPLPNHMHVPWTMRVLEAKKHVLCEKPLGMSKDEVLDLINFAEKYPNLKVMEAFMYRFHPQWIRTKTLIDEGAIGELQTIRSAFSYYKTDPENIRNKPEMGGGGLMDVGCYCISLSRFLFDAEPNRIVGYIEKDPDLKVDKIASGIMDFEHGSSTFTCSMQMEAEQTVTAYGTDGKITIDIPFNPPANKSTTVQLITGGEHQTITVEPSNHYALQGDAFAKSILQNTAVPTPLTDAVANMKAIEAVVESAEKNSWVDL